MYPLFLFRSITDQKNPKSPILQFSVKSFHLWFDSAPNQMSPTFVCFLLVVNMIEAHYVCETWRELENPFSYFLVFFMGNDDAIYAIVYPDIQQIVPPRQPNITLTVSTFAAVLAAKLPYILASVDLDLCPRASEIEFLNEEMGLGWMKFEEIQKMMYWGTPMNEGHLIASASLFFLWYWLFKRREN